MKVFALVVSMLILSVGALANECSRGEEPGEGISLAPMILQSILKDCFSSDLKMSSLKNLFVNGHVLNESEAKNVQWIGECVVPFLPGTREQQAEVAARTTWWALREGNLELTGKHLFGYSNCHEKGKDRLRTNQPGYDCGTNIWQVGIAGGQVANYSEKQYATKIDQVLSSLHNSMNESALLAWAASLAGYDEKSTERKAIISSTGRVKHSWLLRNPLIGFLLVEKQEVTAECIRDRKKWCFNGNYPAAKKFSRSVTGMNKSIADLKRYFLKGT